MWRVHCEFKQGKMHGSMDHRWRLDSMRMHAWDETIDGIELVRGCWGQNHMACGLSWVQRLIHIVTVFVSRV